MEAFDRELLDALQRAHVSRTLTLAMIALTILGSGWSMAALVPLAVASSSRRFALRAAGVLLVAAGIVFALKRAIGRVRPCNAIAGIDALWERPTDPSFPSGHTTGSFAFAALVAALVLSHRRDARAVTTAAVLVLLAIGVGISRVYLGVHYPSDVIGSAVLGTVVGVAGARLGSSRGLACPSSTT